MVLAALRGSVLLLTCAAAGIDVINCDEVSGNPHLIGGIGETSRGKCMTLIESLICLAGSKVTLTLSKKVPRAQACSFSLFHESRSLL